MIRLVQLQNQAGARRVAVVEEPNLRLLASAACVYDLLERPGPLASAIENDLSADTLDYGEIYAAQSRWQLLCPISHPADPARCLVTGTGLTHLASAANRQAMHEAAEKLTDSMKMYQAGVAGGKPAPGQIGIAPEWFYKGNASVLRAPNQPLVVPAYAGDGGEEPEIAGVYWIDPQGRPRRIGLTQANEFSDHRYEKENYLHLAGSKLRHCSLGPELVLGAAFDSVAGTVRIDRGGQIFWSASIRTGEEAMSHSVANMEHHHFKYEGHRRPGDLHVHFFGASAFSFGAGIVLQEGDIMEVSFEGFGRPLRNPLHIESQPPQLFTADPL